MNNNHSFHAEHYPRDLIGYGATPPQANWPGRAKIAVQFVLNYEEGSENTVWMVIRARNGFYQRSWELKVFPLDI